MRYDDDDDDDDEPGKDIITGTLPVKRTRGRQRGSDCTVLTATGLVNGEWQILTPYRIETP